MTPVLVAAVMAALCAPVDGDRILARDMAGAWPAFAGVAGETALGYAPAPGARRVFDGAEMARLAARYGVKGPAPEVCFERPTAPLDREQVLAAMQAALTVPGARIGIIELSAYAVPRGEVVFPRRNLLAPPPGAPPDAPVLWRGEVRYGASGRYRIWARVTLAATAARVTAAEPLFAGRPVAAGQLRVDTREVFPWGRSEAASVDQVAGRRPRRTILAGSSIRLDLLDEVREVETGDAVRVEVSSGAARLAFDGRAESAGRTGQTVRVLNPATRRVFTARVSGKGAVTVRAGGERQ